MTPHHTFRYFHRAPTRSSEPNVDRPATAAGGYRGGTRKGLDLTIAGPVSSTYFSNTAGDTPASRLRGGILLRTLRRVSDSTIISGPSKLVDEILRLNKASNISDLVHQKWGGNTIAFASGASLSDDVSGTSLCIQRKALVGAKATPIIYSSSRIGLDLSHKSTTVSISDPRVIYVAKQYRYFIHPQLLTANGRGHTFLGVYLACRGSDRCESDKDALEAMINASGFKEETAAKYLADYKYGLTKGTLQAFVGASGKGASASPSTYLKMMGTLANVSQEYGQSAEDSA